MDQRDDDRPELFAGVVRSPRPGPARTLLKLALTVAAAGSLVAGLMLSWIAGPAVAAQQGTSLLGDPPHEPVDAQPAGNTAALPPDGTPTTYFSDANPQPA